MTLIFAGELAENRVITIDDHETIIVTTNTTDKSAVILRAISTSHLDVDYVDSFTLLLDFMEML